MRISIAEADGQLSDLVRLARGGEEIILTDEGDPVIRLAPVSSFIANADERDKLIERLQEEVRLKNLPPGPDAARSQDFLYDEHGLPK